MTHNRCAMMQTMPGEPQGMEFVSGQGMKEGEI